MFRNALVGGVLAILMCAVQARASGPRDACPTYWLDGVLPATDCLSVDLTADGTKVYACHNWGPNDNGYRLYDTATRQLLAECLVPGVPWVGLASADGTRVWTSRYYGGYASEVDVLACQMGCNLDICGTGSRLGLHRRDPPLADAPGAIRMSTWSWRIRERRNRPD